MGSSILHDRLRDPRKYITHNLTQVSIDIQHHIKPHRRLEHIPVLSTQNAPIYCRSIGLDS